MSSNIDLENVINDSLNDSQMPDIPDSTSDVESMVVESTTEPVTLGPTEDTPTTEPTDTGAVPSPAVQVTGPDDEFNKRFGLPTNKFGETNRIPHPRVKQMVTKAEKETEARVRKEYEDKLANEFHPKAQYVELETKVKDYEGRLGQVAQFEQIMMNDPQKFLGMLQQVPAYKEFFDYLNQIAAQPQAPAEPQNYLDDKDMPLPDETLADGSAVYSMDGLRKREEWLSRQIEAKAVKQAEESFAKRIAPIEKEWQDKQRYSAAETQVQRQLTEARGKWDRFTEL